MEFTHIPANFTASNKEDTFSMSTFQNTNKPMEDIFQYAKKLHYGELHLKMDESTGLMAIIAIHSTKLGPAIGGCRCISYENTDAAIFDALRLAHMMSYKAAICNLPHGGAKSVLMKPLNIQNREAYFQSFGRFVDQLNGRYIAAVDSGTTVQDMNYINSVTDYVTCTSDSGGGDPSPYTAIGVRRGIEAAVKFKLGKDSLEGIHIAIQGAGHVGYYLAKELLAKGARLTMTDINPSVLRRCVDEFKVDTVTPEEIYSFECDVFSPCALGAVLNPDTIAKLRCPIVAGSANNQLLDLFRDDLLLYERGILYAPDFLINAGGLIQAAAIYDHGDMDKANKQIYDLYDAALAIFERSEKEKKPTNLVAEIIAEEKLR